MGLMKADCFLEHLLIQLYSPCLCQGASLYVAVGVHSALSQAKKDALGTRYLTISIARFIPSVTIFLSLLFQNSSRVSGTMQCYWASLTQVRKTNVSYSHSVCITCLNFHSINLLTLAEFVVHCNSRLLTKNIGSC